MNKFLRPLTGVIISLFAIVSIFSLAIVSWQMNRAAELAHPSSCPFLAHQSAVCPMDFTDHLAIWQKITQSEIVKKIFFTFFSAIIVVSGLIFLKFKTYTRSSWSKTSTSIACLFLPSSLQPRAP